MATQNASMLCCRSRAEFCETLLTVDSVKSLAYGAAHPRNGRRRVAHRRDCALLQCAGAYTNMRSSSVVIRVPLKRTLRQLRPHYSRKKQVWQNVGVFVP